MARARTCAAALALLTLGACAAPSPTRVWLIVDSDLPRDALDEIEIEVDGRAIGAHRETRRVAFGPETALPMTLPITHAGGAMGPIEVRVRARGGVDVEQRARFEFVLGRELELHMELMQACVDVRCGRDETCRGGTCTGTDLALSRAALEGRIADAGAEAICHAVGRPTIATGLVLR